MFIPPHWNHKRIVFPRAEIEVVISGIKTNPFRDNNISSYHANHKRPETIWFKNYNTIISEIMLHMGLFKKYTYRFNYWAQLYLNNHDHLPHNHFGGMDEGCTISFVHFIKPSNKPLFRFLNYEGEYYVPQQQNAGDILCFPSWVWHEAIPNKSDTERFIIAGNITVDHTSVHP